MNNKKLEMYKNKMGKLLLMEALVGSLSLTGCNGSNKTNSNAKSETINNYDWANNDILEPYKEVTLPEDYVLMPGAVAVNEDTDSIIKVMSAINKPNKGYYFINSNYGSLNITGDVKDIDVTVNKDNTITYSASEGYAIYEPYCAKIEDGKIIMINCVTHFNPIKLASKQPVLKKK